MLQELWLKMYEELFAALAKSIFRSRFHLKGKDLEYAKEKGCGVLRRHAADFVRKRLAAPASLMKNDGKQTPMRGHPVFVAQHACACCCRQCLYKWHRIEPNHWLSEAEQVYITDVLIKWIEKELENTKQPPYC